MFNLNSAKAFSRLILLVLACFSISAASCGQPSTPQQSIIPTPTQTPAMPTPAPTLTPTPTPTPTPSKTPTQTPVNPAQTPSTLTVSSKSFTDGGEIPVFYSCNGKNVSPELSWSKGPQDTKTFVLLVKDPDASAAGFVHWVLYNIPAAATGLAEGVSIQSLTDMQAVPGLNGSGKSGYTGPCPPAGKVHHYVFSLYAIDFTLSISSGNYDQILQAIQGHILAQGQIVGTFQR